MKVTSTNFYLSNFHFFFFFNISAKLLFFLCTWIMHTRHFATVDLSDCILIEPFAEHEYATLFNLNPCTFFFALIYMDYKLWFNFRWLIETSATTERSFFKLKIIKIYLRASTLYYRYRLSNLKNSPIKVKKNKLKRKEKIFSETIIRK